MKIEFTYLGLMQFMSIDKLRKNKGLSKYSWIHKLYWYKIMRTKIAVFKNVHARQKLNYCLYCNTWQLAQLQRSNDVWYICFAVYKWKTFLMCVLNIKRPKILRRIFHGMPFGLKLTLRHKKSSKDQPNMLMIKEFM